MDGEWDEPLSELDIPALLELWEEPQTVEDREELRRELEARRVPARLIPQHPPPLESRPAWEDEDDPPEEPKEADEAEEPPDRVPGRHYSDSELLELIRERPVRSASGSSGLIVLLFTGFLFVQFRGGEVGLTMILLLALVVLIHELGHVLAMTIFRYKNVKMLFLPFVGGLAIGEPREQNATKIAWIALAGPMLGLLSAAVALWMFTRTAEPRLFDYAKLALIINAFNLLPLIPLDGGHFLSEALFARSPALQTGFKIVTAGALILLGYWGDMLLLSVIGLLVLVTVPATHQMARTAARLRRAGEPREAELTEDLVGRIRSAHRAAGTVRDATLAKTEAGVVRTTFELIQKRFPGVGGTLLLIGCFVVVLFAAVLLYGILGIVADHHGIRLALLPAGGAGLSG